MSPQMELLDLSVLTPRTENPSGWRINDRKVFLPVLEIGSLRSGPTWSSWEEDPLPCYMWLTSCLLIGQVSVLSGGH